MSQGYALDLCQVVFVAKVGGILAALENASESPIETQMGASLVANCIKLGCDLRVGDLAIDSDPNVPVRVVIRPQHAVGKYRADFHLTMVDTCSQEVVRAVVECDGHDYHERTKKQAARDKSRDRAMQALGLRVFRYTGSEIYNGARDLGTELLHTMFNLIMGEPHG